MWVSPYDIYTEANIGVVNRICQQFIHNNYRLAGSGRALNSAVDVTPVATTIRSLSSIRIPGTRTASIRAVPIYRKRSAAIMAAWE